jgi:elongation factor P
MVLEHQAKLWRVLKTEHVKPGKGPAYLQAEMKSIPDGIKLNERFRAAETVERVRLDEAQYQFLYEDDTGLHFMEQESFEQVTLSREMLGDQARYLQEGMICTVETHEGRPLGVRLPETVTLEVVDADPVVKGQTAAASYKPATLDNGVRIMVPPHIERGTRVVVNTGDSSYVERARD